MLKDRFGGLYSVLNSRDIQTLRNFENWVLFEQTFLDPYAWKTPTSSPNTDPRFSGGFELDLASFLELPLEEMLELLQYTKLDLEDQCREYTTQGSWRRQNRPYLDMAEDLQEYSYLTDKLGSEEHDEKEKVNKAEDLRQCRYWIAQLDPIIRKLGRGVYRLRNEAL